MSRGLIQALISGFFLFQAGLGLQVYLQIEGPPWSRPLWSRAPWSRPPCRGSEVPAQPLCFLEVGVLSFERAISMQRKTPERGRCWESPIICLTPWGLSAKRLLFPRVLSQCLQGGMAAHTPRWLFWLRRANLGARAGEKPQPPLQHILMGHLRETQGFWSRIEIPALRCPPV